MQRMATAPGTEGEVKLWMPVRWEYYGDVVFPYYLLKVNGGTESLAEIQHQPDDNTWEWDTNKGSGFVPTLRAAKLAVEQRLGIERRE